MNNFNATAKRKIETHTHQQQPLNFPSSVKSKSELQKVNRVYEILVLNFDPVRPSYLRLGYWEDPRSRRNRVVRIDSKRLAIGDSHAGMFDYIRAETYSC